MTIGYVNPEYGCKRNIVGCCQSCNYVRVRSFKTLKERVMDSFGLLPKCLQPYYYCGGVPESFRHIDLMHFWNNIALFPSVKPYITTFETTLPRKFPNEEMLRRGITSMLSHKCKRIIALSNHAKQRQVEFDKEAGCSELDKKICVLLPPQRVLTSESDIEVKMAAHIGDVGLRLMFVGRDCFRKGGGELIRAAIKLRKSIPLELFIVGDFSRITYACSRDIDNYDEIMRIVEANRGWIHMFKELTNTEVLSLARKCHIGCLPTRDDTFGYSVLEFHACGLPCITTDIRALPEINNNEIGWMINVPKLPNGRADFTTREKLHQLSQVIEDGLIEIIGRISARPEQIYAKSMKSLEKIRRNHNPQDFSRRIGLVYQEAIG